MDSVEQALSAEESEQREALASRLFQSVLGAMDLFHIYLGTQLGLYDALHRQGWATSAELASATAPSISTGVNALNAIFPSSNVLMIPFSRGRSAICQLPI